eukprot:13854598-Alexandrium_andersonii.AAC.1
MVSRESMDPMDVRHLTNAETKGGLPVGSLLGLGLWLDGVACRWDRSETLDCITMSFPGFPDRWRNVRLPLAVLEHKFVSQHTMDDLLDIL